MGTLLAADRLVLLGGCARKPVPWQRGHTDTHVIFFCAFFFSNIHVPKQEDSSMNLSGAQKP